MGGSDQQIPARAGKIVWVGRVISALMVAALSMSAVMKLQGGPDVAKEIDRLGLNESLILPLAILEFTCVILYAIPPTCVLGAILLTGYLGGAICTHWRIGDPFVPQIVIGVLIWLGIFLRDDRLRSLIPLRWSKL